MWLACSPQVPPLRKLAGGPWYSVRRTIHNYRRGRTHTSHTSAPVLTLITPDLLASWEIVRLSLDLQSSLEGRELCRTPVSLVRFGNEFAVEPAKATACLDAQSRSTSH